MNITRDTVHKTFFFLILAAATVLFLYVMYEFLYPVFWAVVFALLLRPVYAWLLKYVRNPSLAAGIAVVLFLIFIIGPITALLAQLAREAIEFYQYASSVNVFVAFLSHPLVAWAIEWTGRTPEMLGAQLVSYLQSASSWLVASAVTVSTATATTLLKALLMFYLLFYFLRDGEALRRYLIRRSPLPPETTRTFFSRFAEIAGAITRGTFLIAMLQGLVGGLLFWFVGILNPVLWGSVMAFLSMIPGVGAFIVWMPASAWLFLEGDTIGGAIVLLVGALVISLLDNLLRPLLVEQEVRLPAALILVSILGGIATFGITGLVIGPLAAAGALAAWDYFASLYAQEETFVA